MADADTLEIYGQLSYGSAYIKYSHAISNLFGIAYASPVNGKFMGKTTLALTVSKTF